MDGVDSFLVRINARLMYVITTVSSVGLPRIVLRTSVCGHTSLRKPFESNERPIPRAMVASGVQKVLWAISRLHAVLWRRFGILIKSLMCL